MSDSDLGMLGAWRMDLEAMDLSQAVKPVVNPVGGVLLEGDFSRTKTIAEENTGSVFGDSADNLELDRRQLLVGYIKSLSIRTVVVVF